MADGELLWVDYQAGTVEVGDERFSFTPYPPNLLAILESGGLIPHLMKQVNR